MSTFKKAILFASAGYVGLQIARTLVRHNRDFDWRGKRVVITGGSRGLGLVIARQLADQGARVAITARTESDLDTAAQELRQRGAEVISHPSDVRDRSQVASFMTGLSASGMALTFSLTLRESSPSGRSTR